MRLTIDITAEQFAALSEKAKELGVDTLDDVVRHLITPKPNPSWLADKEPYDPKVQRSRKRCSICGRPGHYATRCKKRDPTNPPKPRACTKCGRPGHNIATCPSPEQIVRVKPEPPPPLTPEERRESYAEAVEKRYPGLVTRLGAETDYALAKVYGLSRQRIHQIRQRLEIEASYEPPTFPKEAVPLLGTMPDTVLAEQLGFGKARIRAEREQRGVPSFEYVPPEEAKINEVRHLVGEISDRKLAAQIGVHHADVYRFRKKYGIETKVISPKHKDFVPIDKAEIERLFNEGMSDVEIAEIVGGSVGTISGIRSRLGLLRKERGIPLTDEEKAKILRFRKAGRSYVFIANALDRPMETISAFVRRTKG